MEDLIKALIIFLKYGNPKWPTHCEHDTLQVNINPYIVSDEDKKLLADLDFFIDTEYDCFISYRFGSS
jgi:hypothetical protein